jgi:DNA mismatch repair protein MutL
MSAEELGLCVLRHATSKLTDDNLVRITTLGFRGEALPSIGAAARLEITSRPQRAEAAPTDHAPTGHALTDHASIIAVEGGHVGPVAPAAGGQGTRVVVRDLFFATPARRKFLKSPRIEAEHADSVVRRLALSAPHVAFRLDLDGRTVFEAPSQSRIDRVAALLGSEAAAVMLPVAEERQTQGTVLRISGYICSPAVTRATPIAQTLIVNNRPVADPVLRTAIKVAYRDVIAAGRHPIVALYLDVPPDELDVNVHPAKTELRFRDAGAIRSLVIGSVRRALGVGTSQAVPSPSLGPAPAFYAWSPPPRPTYPATAAPPMVLTAGEPAPTFHGPTFYSMAEAQLPFTGMPVARQFTPVAPSPDHPLGAPVAQVLDTYIIAVAADGSLVLVDQHAAHERLTHEAIREQMLDGAVRSQPMLMPAVVDLPAGDVARLVARAEDLARLGLELEEFGPGAILVRALPAVLGTIEPAPLLRDLADEFADMDEQTALSARLDAVIARLACHGSIRAGRKLGPAEMAALLRRMEATPRAATCSHGRPTVLKLSKSDIEKMFGRR